MGTAHQQRRTLPGHRGGQCPPYLHPPAFTLLELIIVLGIVMLLIAITAPSLRNAAAAGRSVECASNLRQMALAATQYALEYRYFPPAVRSEVRGGVLHVIAWDWVSTFTGDTVSPGPLWQFTDDPGKVQQCPEYRDESNFPGDPYTGYNYNTTYLGGEGPIAAPGWAAFRDGAIYSRSRRTTTCAIFGCGGFAGGANKFMRAPMNTVEGNINLIYAGGQAFRHRGTCNVAFIDGHTEPRTTPHPGDKATEDRLTNLMDYPRNGFLSNDDSAYNPR